MTLLNYILFPIFIISLHWISVRFYSEYCVPSDFYGYIFTYFTVSSPTCIYVLQIIEKTSSIYNILCATFSIWSCSTLVELCKRILK